MARVICDLPNASDEIRGVKFHPLEEGGLISDEIDDELASVFASINGYSLADPGLEPAKPDPKPAPKSRGAKKAAPAAPKPAEDAPPQSAVDHGAAGDDDAGSDGSASDEVF